MTQSGELSPTPALKAYATALIAARGALSIEPDALESVHRIAGRIMEAAERFLLSGNLGTTTVLDLFR